MTGWQGMDTSQVGAQADALTLGRRRLEGLASRLAVLIRASEWSGPDAEDFRRRWTRIHSHQVRDAAEALDGAAHLLRDEAREQELASAPSVAGAGLRLPGPASDTAPPGLDGAGLHRMGGALGRGGGLFQGQEARGRPDAGYLERDAAWLPDRWEEPLEAVASSRAHLASEAIGDGGRLVHETVVETGESLGLEMDGVDILARDGAHAGAVLTAWATGERTPTAAELLASGALVLGSGAVAGHEILTGEDSPLLDDRPSGRVHRVDVDEGGAAAPRSLQDLILDNNSLRMPNPTRSPLDSSLIGIQEVAPARGGQPAYIVQIPPTEGGGIGEVPGSWGAQGGSRDWASNLRLVAGQDTAAMQDVRAAMRSAGVPAGADVLLMGHSQGGIIANRLAADPSFNTTGGTDGTYAITHVISVGSPVETVVPARGSTTSVNIAHALDVAPEGLSGDLIAGLDLGGVQVDGGRLQSANRQEVSLPGYPTATLDPIEVLEHNHNAVGHLGEADLGYAGSVGRRTPSDPALQSLTRDLTGVYLGEELVVTRSVTVEVGRGPHR